MSFDEFEKATDDDLKAEAKRCFDESRALTPADLHYKAPLMLEAQFYMQERDRRDSSRVALRDLRLELVVIGLIGIEIVLSIVGIVIAVREGNAQATLTEKQTGILTSLQQSSSDTAQTLKGLLETTGKMNESASSTAGTLGHLQSTTEAMNKAVQAQLSLFYQPSVSALFDMSTKRILLTNSGRTNVTIAGIKYADLPIEDLHPTQIIPPSSSWFAYVEQLEKNLEAITPKGTMKSVPISFYLLDEHHKKYVMNGHLLAGWPEDKFQIFIQVESVQPEATTVSAPSTIHSLSSNPQNPQ